MLSGFVADILTSNSTSRNSTLPASQQYKIQLQRHKKILPQSLVVRITNRCTQSEELALYLSQNSSAYENPPPIMSNSIPKTNPLKRPPFDVLKLFNDLVKPLGEGGRY